MVSVFKTQPVRTAIELVGILLIGIGVRVRVLVN